jgi:carotenoid cleavage dioxygenase-like enzyme
VSCWTRCATTTPGFRKVWGDIGGPTGEHAERPLAERPVGVREPGHTQAPSVLYRWTLDPVAGRVTESQLDDREAEFPTHNETLTGRPNRYLYTVNGDGIAKHDLDAPDR